MKLRASLVLSLLAALCIVLAPPASASDGLVSGKVVETMDSGGYTYVLLEDNGSKIWVAVPRMEITVGSRVAFRSGTEMTDFTSKSLKRTFDRIIFSQGPAAGKKKEATPWEELKVKKPAAANAYTVAELYKEINKLKGKPVVVRGQVVSISPNIMQKNWIHLQDGSGTPKKGDHDIVITTRGKASVGEIITVTGTLAKDRDYGFSYKYPVIIEDATLSK